MREIFSGFRILCLSCPTITPINIQVGIDNSIRMTCMVCGKSIIEIPNMGGVTDPILIKHRNAIIERLQELKKIEMEQLQKSKISIAKEEKKQTKAKITAHSKLIKEIIESGDMENIKKNKASLTVYEELYITDMIKAKKNKIGSDILT